MLHTLLKPSRGVWRRTRLIRFHAPLAAVVFDVEVVGDPGGLDFARRSSKCACAQLPSFPFSKKVAFLCGSPTELSDQAGAWLLGILALGETWGR